MKIDTLSFLNCLLVNHAPSVFHPHIQVIVPVRTNSRFVKVWLGVKQSNPSGPSWKGNGAQNREIHPDRENGHAKITGALKKVKNQVMACSHQTPSKTDVKTVSFTNGLFLHSNTEVTNITLVFSFISRENYDNAGRFWICSEVLCLKRIGHFDEFNLYLQIYQNTFDILHLIQVILW